MIDYLTCRITLPRALPRTIDDGCTIRRAQDGTLQQVTAHRLGIVGSYEATLQLRSVSHTELELQGNPAKFLQGHNLYGPSDLLTLLWDALTAALPLTPAACTLADVGIHSTADFQGVVTRVDLTHMFELASESDVRAWLRTAELVAHIARRGKGVMHGNTLVMGSASGKSFTRWQIVIYGKGSEVRARPLPGPMMAHPSVLDWASRNLRVEVRFGRLELEKQGLRSLGAWSDVDDNRCDDLWRRKVDQLEFNLKDREFDLDSLPTSLRTTYVAWTTGADVRNLLTRATYFRYRGQLLKLAGIDISVPPPVQPTAEIIPLRRVIDVKPCGRPDWADEVDELLARAGGLVLRRAA
jgi:II/X family phage/plasmid replication protein